MIVTCPKPEELTDVPAQDCPVDFDQIIMAIFQRNNAAAIFTPATILLLATWTPLLTAEDDTKVVATPKFAELVIPQSAALTQGGNDNTTVAGIPYYTGEGTVEVTAQIPSMSADVKKALKDLSPESIVNMLGKTGLTVFFVNRFGQIIANKRGDADITGFDCFNVRFSTVGSEGFNSKNKNQMGIGLADGWDDNVVIYKPSFDILSSIVNG